MAKNKKTIEKQKNAHISTVVWDWRSALFLLEMYKNNLSFVQLFKNGLLIYFSETSTVVSNSEWL